MRSPVTMVAPRHLLPDAREALVEAGRASRMKARAGGARGAPWRASEISGSTVTARDGGQQPGQGGGRCTKRSTSRRLRRTFTGEVSSPTLAKPTRFTIGSELRVRAAVRAGQPLLGEQVQCRPLQGQRRTQPAVAGIDGEVRADRRSHGLAFQPEHGGQQRGHTHEAPGCALAREKEVGRTERAPVVVLGEAPGARRVGKVAAAEVEHLLAMDAPVPRAG